MELNTVWFVLIAVLYAGFFLLEGFDFGVGILLPFLGKDDVRRRAIINTIAPVWDGNEVWLLTAGGATFAAFPGWYATLFSGFYLALFVLLLALIVRGVSFEFRSKDPNPRWRALFDWFIFVGSVVPPLLLGVAFANLINGVPIDSRMIFVGSFFDLLSPYALFGGLTLLALCALYGAAFLSLKTTGDLEPGAQRMARRLWPITALLVVGYWGWTYLDLMIPRLGVNPGVIPIALLVAILFAGYFIRRRAMVWAFVLLALSILLSIASYFLILFPRLIVSSLGDQYSLTISNASSSPYTLSVMTIVAVVLVPVVLLYQGWTYWVFRQRLEAKPEQLVY